MWATPVRQKESKYLSRVITSPKAVTINIFDMCNKEPTLYDPRLEKDNMKLLKEYYSEIDKIDTKSKENSQEQNQKESISKPNRMSPSLHKSWSTDRKAYEPRYSIKIDEDVFKNERSKLMLKNSSDLFHIYNSNLTQENLVLKRKLAEAQTQILELHKQLEQERNLKTVQIWKLWSQKKADDQNQSKIGDIINEQIEKIKQEYEDDLLFQQLEQEAKIVAIREEQKKNEGGWATNCSTAKVSSQLVNSNNSLTVSSNTSSTKRFPPISVADEHKSTDLPSNLKWFKSKRLNMDENKSQQKTESWDQSSTEKSIENLSNFEKRDLYELTQNQ